MKLAAGPLALLVALVGVAEVAAQVGQRPVVGARVAVPIRTGRIGFSIGIGGCCNPYHSCGFFGISNITVLAPPPPIFLPPGLIAPPEPVPEPPPDPLMVEPRVFRPREPQRAVPAPEKPLPGAIAGGFRPIRPDDRVRAQQPAAPEMPRRPPAPLPQPAAPDPDPRVENGRLAAQGREAFQAGEYGRAAVRFRQAIEAAPREPLPHFLLAEAEFALGRFREAVAALHTGLRLWPDWPTTLWRPSNLYGADHADFAEHLRRLREALDRNPEDPVLLFLYAYQLWFDGRQAEARPLFQKAAGLVADPTFIDRFLRAAIPGPVAAR
jgi:hypothetical protein